MDTWNREYRDRHPMAAAWAKGSRKVCHSEETQGRIFRMAEQLKVEFGWSNVAPLFSILEALDEVVDAETSAAGRPHPATVAAAADVGYKLLFGSLPPTEDYGWPSGFEAVAAEDAALARLGLQAQGYDPLLIDGIDPAAYLWALYEMRQRRLACADVERLQQHLPHFPRCLAALPDGAVQAMPLPGRSHAAAVGAK